MSESVTPQPIQEPVSVDDNGAALTVDGTVAVTNAGLTELAAAIDTEVQADIVGALPAGNNNIGDVDVASIAAGDNNIGNVDIASIAAGDNNIGNVDVVTLPALPAGNNNIGDVDVASSALPTGASTLAEQQAQTTHLATIAGDTTDIEAAVEILDNSVYVDDADFTDGTSSGTGVMAVAESASPTTVTEGDMGMLAMTLERLLKMTNHASSVGGASTFYSTDLDESEEEVKTTAGTVYGWIITNRTTAPVYIHFYNATTGNVTVGTTAAQFVFAVPGNATDYVAANVLGGVGIAFATAISVAATTDFPDDGSPAGPAANGVICTVFYK